MNDRFDNDDSRFEAALRELRRPPPRPMDAVESIMDECGREVRPTLRSYLSGAWAWLSRPRISLSPLGAAGSFAVIAVAAIAISGLPRTGGSDGGGSALVRHQFVLVAPEASSVAVVGDFNDWDPTTNPLARAEGDGVWVAELDLEEGRHLYSFVVDGVHWVRDEEAPHAPEDDFGRPSSVLLIPGVRPRGT